MQLGHKPPRIIIENVYPELDAGRYPVKRVRGDRFEVWADIFAEGHDGLKAVLRYRKDKDKQWSEVPMVALGNDRWHAAFLLGENGRYQYSILAWPDVIGTWHADTRKKQAAKQDISLDLLEGRLLAQQVLKAVKRQKTQKALQEKLQSEKIDLLQDTLLDPAVIAELEAADPRTNAVEYKILNVIADRPRAAFSAWYEIFPRSQGTDASRSSTFNDCIARLPDIRAMGFDVLYLTPIHPIGKVNRKGRNNSLKAEAGDPGSPYAIADHKAVHPELGTLTDFRALVEATKAHDMEIALDFAIQCAPDHPYVKEHPEWFVVRPDGSIKYAENPPKKYEDIVNVDFFCEDWKNLWEELCSIVLFWVEQGVRIFRVDNPHTKPFAFWEWMIATVQEQHPDVIFLSEAFTRPKIMYLLAKAGFTQSYTYFTWRDTKAELTEYLTELTQDWPKDYFRPNFFANTPDILPRYLQGSGKPGFIVRAALAATLGGNYGLYSGFEFCEAAPVPGKEEYLDSEKYEFKVRDWDAPGNIKGFISKLNWIRNENTAFRHFRSLRFHPSSNPNVIFYSKHSPEWDNLVFVAVNLDPHNTQDTTIELPQDRHIHPHNTTRMEDLLLGHSWDWQGTTHHLRLSPSNNPVTIFRLA